MPDADLFLPRQTNTGLFVQMHAAGFSRQDVETIQRVYRQVIRLFNGRYRKTERAFVCHTVGVASSVARFDDRITFVLAGMLHAAYDSGQFPGGWIGRPTPGHRAWLTELVGTEIESLVHRYASFDFEKGVPERYAAEGYDPSDRDLMLIALAHEVDDMADLGLLFSPKYGRSLGSRVEACASLAEGTGKPELAATLRAHGRLYEDADWVEGLESPGLHGYQIVPNGFAYLRYRVEHLRRRYVKVN